MLTPEQIEAERKKYGIKIDAEKTPKVETSEERVKRFYDHIEQAKKANPKINDLLPKKSEQQPEKEKPKSFLRKVGDFLTGSEQKLAETYGTALATGTKDFKSAQNIPIEEAENERKIVDAIISNENAGKDSTRLREFLAQQKGVDIPTLEEQIPALKKTTKQIIGESVGVAADIIGGGTFGKGAVGAVATKQPILKTALKGAGVGSAWGGIGSGAMAMQEDKSAGEILKDTTFGAGVGAVLGGVVMPAVAGGISKLIGSNANKIAGQSKAVDDYLSVLNPTKGEFKKIEVRKGGDIKDPVAALVRAGAVLKKEGNKISTTDAIQVVREKSDEIEEGLNSLLASKKTGKYVNSRTGKSGDFNLFELAEQAKNKVNEMNVLATVKNGIKEEIDDIVEAEISERGDRVLTSLEANKFKQQLWKVSRFDSLGQQRPNAVDASRALGFSIKEGIENTFKDSDIKGLNKELGNYIEGIKLLENAHGRAIKGRFENQIINRLVGAMVGASTRVPVVGPLAGEFVGKKLTEFGTSPERLSMKAIGSFNKAKGQGFLGEKIQRGVNALNKEYTPVDRAAKEAVEQIKKIPADERGFAKNPFSSPAVGQAADLATDLRKYKTAEEFVKFPNNNADKIKKINEFAKIDPNFSLYAKQNGRKFVYDEIESIEADFVDVPTRLSSKNDMRTVKDYIINHTDGTISKLRNPIFEIPEQSKSQLIDIWNKAHGK